MKLLSESNLNGVPKDPDKSIWFMSNADGRQHYRPVHLWAASAHKQSQVKEQMDSCASGDNSSLRHLVVDALHMSQPCKGVSNRLHIQCGSIRNCRLTANDLPNPETEPVDNIQRELDAGHLLNTSQVLHFDSHIAVVVVVGNYLQRVLNELSNCHDSVDRPRCTILLVEGKIEVA